MLTVGCTKSDLAFDLVESPVLIEFDGPDSSAEMFEMTATVTELDKTGILDNKVGIVSTPINGLTLSVYSEQDNLLDELTTNGQGEVILNKDWNDMGSISRLEWTGIHNGISFRIYKNI